MTAPGLDRPDGEESEPGTASELMTIDELTALLRKPKGSVYKMVASNRIPGKKKIGRDWRFLRSEVEAWLRRGTQGGRHGAGLDEAEEQVPVGHRGGTSSTEAVLARIFTPDQMVALEQHWITTPMALLAQGVRNDGRQRLGLLLGMSEDEIVERCLAVAALSGWSPMTGR